jgi:hypothetical protein
MIPLDDDLEEVRVSALGGRFGLLDAAARAEDLRRMERRVRGAGG